MLYSIYAYLKPSVLEADNQYFNDWFGQLPHRTIPYIEDGQEVLFTFIKPRYYEGDSDCFMKFMDALTEVRDHIYNISLDSGSHQLVELMDQTGYGHLVPFVMED